MQPLDPPSSSFSFLVSPCLVHPDIILPGIRPPLVFPSIPLFFLLFVISPGHHRPEGIHPLRFPLLPTPNPLPVGEHDIFRPPAHLFPVHPRSHIRPDPSSSPSSVPPVQTSGIRRARRVSSDRGPHVPSQERPGIPPIPHQRPLRIQQTLVAVEMEQRGHARRVHVGGQRHLLPTRFATDVVQRRRERKQNSFAEILAVVARRSVRVWRGRTLDVERQGERSGPQGLVSFLDLR